MERAYQPFKNQKIRWYLPFLFFFFSNCRDTSRSAGHHQENLSKSDTLELLQTMLNDKKLDSLLSFAFKGKPLKIVRNEIIQKDYRLIFNDIPVQFSNIDSTSEELFDWTRPKFFTQVRYLKILKGEHAEISMSWKGIGLLSRYKFKKNYQGRWQITERHFGRFK
ncbi:hypothetical protein [Larkinella soli]|uniref:hypothetical protein n=1 Tax=Larkinella soli TaxID=1770527 RepID=UPI000FFB5FCA|nr:hypothetical protein [Larkinella soli]